MPTRRITANDHRPANGGDLGRHSGGRGMIHFDCPRCGDRLSVPESLSGDMQRCPKCGDLVVVPAPGQEDGGNLWDKARVWCRRRPHLAAGIGAGGFLVFVLVLWACFSGGSEDGSVAKGFFASRSDLGVVLAECGFYPVGKPRTGVLRARELQAFDYCVNANFPEFRLTVHCSPDDPQKVVALSSEIGGLGPSDKPLNALYSVLAKRPAGISDHEWRRRRARGSHTREVVSVIRRISRIDAGVMKLSGRVPEKKGEFGIKKGREDHYWAGHAPKTLGDGAFSLERIDFWPVEGGVPHAGYPKGQPVTLLILRDANWMP